MRGNCYTTSEALYHLLGGKAGGWTPMRMSIRNDTHWFLKHQSGFILDATVRQFKKKPRYEKAVGCGFLTKQPSKDAKVLMDLLTWKQLILFF